MHLLISCLMPVHVERKPEVAVARSYRDYHVTVDDTLPGGVTCERLG